MMRSELYIDGKWRAPMRGGIGRELGRWGLDAYVEGKHKTRRIKAA